MKRVLYLRGGMALLFLWTSVLGITQLAITHDLDLKISSYFYSPEQGWTLTEVQPWKFLYVYGPAIGVLFTLVCAIFLGITYFKKKYYSWRLYFLLILLTTFIGPLFIVNAVLKDYWGRPRPRQVQQFDGKWEYRAPNQPGVPSKGSSFTCGHCAIAFVLSTAIIFQAKSPFLGGIGGLLGLTYGILMSIARIGQGGHFFTDALWSFAIVWTCAIILYYFILKIPIYSFYPSRSFSLKESFPSLLGSSIVGVMAIVVFSFFRPLYEDHIHFLPLHENLESFEYQIDSPDYSVDNPNYTVNIRYSDKAIPSVRSIVKGVGSAEAKYRILIRRTEQNNRFHLNYSLIPKGYFAKQSVAILLTLPKHLRSKVYLPEKGHLIPQKDYLFD